MLYLIDSDIVIDHLGDVTAVTAMLENMATDGIAISIITYMEVFQGRIRGHDPTAALAAFNVFLSTAPILPLTTASAERCARLREQLAAQGKRVRARALDLITASIAIEYGLTLVTRNTHDYDDIPGLALYQW
jgi:tRNA(fMet)-specific endonuclease VapC